MRIDLRVAALDEATEQRVRLAATLLGAYRLRVRVDAWDGSRCHLLLACPHDPWGKRATEQAGRRGVPVMDVCMACAASAGETVPADISAAGLARAIRQKLAVVLTPPAPEASVDDLPGIYRLAQSGWRGKPAVASGDGRMVLTRPETGRVYAATRSDLLAAGDALVGAKWQIALEDPPRDTSELVSGSLEAFLLVAAIKSAARAPAFPAGRYRLETWPDLGTATTVVAALRVAKLLLGTPQSAVSLAQALPDVDVKQIHACLWAFAAADLLRQDDGIDSPVAASPARPRDGVWAGLARRFGLLRD
ncbi:MAG TPA: hypothetical protein VFN09_11370 [Rhodanobacteraceae bacterium]|nr:hypothetical protein [Rhodanobacteraceae bacterium]